MDPITRETLIAGIEHLDLDTLRQEYAAEVLKLIDLMRRSERLEIVARNVAGEAKIHGQSARLVERALGLQTYCDDLRFGSGA